MKQTQYFKSQVVYQIYPRSFCDSNGDGIGDIPGIISKLDYLKELGVGVIWLSPIYPSPNVDFGYDVSSYCEVSSDYGTLDDFKNLVLQSEKRGIKIVMDLVINHTSTKHRWFIESKKDNSPYRNYYFWRKGRNKNKKAPNNWQSMFSTSAWKYDDEADSWYLHLYSEEQADLNFNNPKVIEEVKNIITFWLDLGVYGFRLDVINNIFKSSLKNAKPSLSRRGKEYYANQDGCHKILQEFHDEIFSKRESMTVGECYMLSLQDAKKFTTNELDMVFQFDHMNVDKRSIPIFSKKFNPERFKNILFKWQKGIQWNANYLENHDQPRSVSHFGSKRYHDESAKCLAMLLLCLKGTPFIYQGEEIGMTNSEFNDIKEIKDISAIGVYKMLRKAHFGEKKALKIANNINRDHARTPMQWDNSINAGFTGGIPWIKVNPNYADINVMAENKNPDSVLSFYKELLLIKKENKVLIEGEFIPIHTSGSLISFARKNDEHEFQIVINLSEKNIKNPIFLRGEVLISNYLRNDYETVDSLLPFECALIKIR